MCRAQAVGHGEEHTRGVRGHDKPGCRKADTTSSEILKCHEGCYSRGRPHLKGVTNAQTTFGDEQCRLTLGQLSEGTTNDILTDPADVVTEGNDGGLSRGEGGGAEEMVHLAGVKGVP